MRFGTKEIPTRLFDLARERLARATSTPEHVRQHIVQHGAAELQQLSAIPKNHWIIAERVFQVVRMELAKAGAIKQLKRGVWATSEFMRNADAQQQAHDQTHGTP